MTQQTFDLALQHHQSGRLREAEELYRQILAQQPDHAGATHHLGVIANQIGRNDIAVDLIRRAIAISPNYAEAYCNLGNALKDRGEFDQAIAAYRRAIALYPNFYQAHSHLGAALQNQGQLDAAIAEYRHAIALNPNHGEAHNNLGNALKDQGEIEEALAEYRRAMAIDPANHRRESNLLYALHFHPAYSAEAIAEEHRRWNRQHGQRLAKFIPIHANERDPDRALRIGYVSPDFCGHSVSFFLLPLLRARDRRQFHVTCYTISSARDAVTDQIQACTDQWVSLASDSDEAAAGQIGADRIDILVDLAGHTSQNRLLIFARKPAPVQATYLGYPNTTGLTAIDWRLTDWIADPAGAERLHTEQLYRLPRTAWCFAPILGSPPVGPREDGPIVFGSFNDSAKINKPLLALWARILARVPDSRLLLKNRMTLAASVRQSLRRELEAGGIEWDRITLLPRQASYAEHLHCYDRIDIALDTYPYHGTATTCEALWMGVPVTTLAGQTHVSRVGASLLSSIGLQELIATDVDGYVKRAVQLAADVDRLGELRRTLRQRMEQSPLMDTASFAGDVEAAYRAMWRAWCAKASPT